jgi:REP element-mobilizing transposase RayT
MTMDAHQVMPYHPAPHRIGIKKMETQSVGVIINQYKRKCTIDAWKTNPVFAWQSRYHDHIIRNDQEFQRIKEYIINNPKNWETDSLR